jgi:hypothetical protein
MKKLTVSLSQTEAGTSHMWYGFHRGTGSSLSQGRLKLADDLVVPRFGCVLRERLPKSVMRSGKCGQPSQEPADPANIIFANGKDEVLDLHSQNRALLPKVLDRPSRGSGMVAAIPGIDVGAIPQQQLDNLPVAVQRRLVQSGRAFVISRFKGC